METKIAFFFSLFVCVITGCGLPIVTPEGTVDTTWRIDSELVDAIARGQSIPGRVRNIKGNTIDISFSEDLCPCSKKRKLKMSVSEVDATGVKGYERLINGFGDLYNLVNEDEYQKTCELFAVAQGAIDDAINLSGNVRHYYLDSYKLIWEAERALGPVECDSIRAKILADKAMQVSLDEGAKALGFDITGTYDSEVTGDHPVFTALNSGKLKLVIKQNGQNITGTDSSGRAILIGLRSDHPLKPFKQDIISIKFSIPGVSAKEIEGEWEVSFNGLDLEGKWHDPDNNVSGKWNLYQIDQRREVEPWKNGKKHAEKFLAQKSSIKIDWGEIEDITVWEKDIAWCFRFVGGQCVTKW